MLLVAALALVATACSDDAEEATTTPPTTTTTAVPTTTTAASTTTAAPTTTTATTTTTAPPTTTTTTVPGLPPPLDLATISGLVWGLYLYSGERLDLPAAWVAFVNVGTYTAMTDVPSANHYSFGEFGCDLGAAEALGVDPSFLTISMYFATEADASAALAALPPDPSPVGIAEVELFCAD